MNKLLVATIVSSIALLSNTALAVKTFNGPTNLKEEEYKEAIVVNGPLKADSATFTKGLTVNGPLTANDCDFQEVVVMGPVDMKESDIKSLDVTGPAKLSTTSVNVLKVNGSAVLDDSDVKYFEVTGGKAVHLTHADIVNFKSTSQDVITLMLNSDSSVGLAEFPNKKGTVIIEDAFSVVKDVDGVETKRLKPNH